MCNKSSAAVPTIAAVAGISILLTTLHRGLLAVAPPRRSTASPLDANATTEKTDMDCLLVCSGVGVMPMLTVLQTLAAEKNEHRPSSASSLDEDVGSEGGQVQRVGVLVWCVRGLALPTALWPTLSALASDANVTVRIFDFDVPETDALSADRQGSFVQQHLSRAEAHVLRQWQVGPPRRRTHNAPTPALVNFTDGRDDAGDDTEVPAPASPIRSDGEEPQTVLHEVAAVTSRGSPDLGEILDVEFSSAPDADDVLDGPDGLEAPDRDAMPSEDDNEDVALPATGSRSKPIVRLLCCGPPGLLQECRAAAAAQEGLVVRVEDVGHGVARSIASAFS